MKMSPRVRKLGLTVHVIASAGWLGAALVFVALSIGGLTLDNEQAVRAVYLAMEPAGRYALLPLAVASFVSGMVQSLGTDWGLFRHYWVVFKLGINVFATLILVMYLGTFRAIAENASESVVALETVRNPSPLIHSVLGVIALTVATVLAVYKPRGALHVSNPLKR
jgi:hypothetical protein